MPLERDEPLECGVALDERSVGAASDRTAVHVEDDVGPGDRGQPVRDHERGPAGHEALDRGEEMCLRVQVEPRRRLVEDQDRSVATEGARQRQPLTFATRERRRTLADNRVVPLRQPLDELVCTRVAGGAADPLVGGRRRAEGDVARMDVPKRTASCATMLTWSRSDSSVRSRTSNPSMRTVPLVAS